MTYGPEVRVGKTGYSFLVTHDSTGVQADITVNFREEPISNEAQRDGIFQAFLTAIENIAGATTSNAKKVGGFSATVTP